MPLPAFATFGDLLKYLRRRARLTQKELSIETGYSESHISRLEKNQRPPDPAAVAALFVSALHLKNEPEMAALLIEMAHSAREDSSPAAHPPSSITNDQLPVTNLPSPPTPHHGRERETAEVAAILRRPDVRLLTLTGPGGVGKTRLAIQVAGELAESFPDGLWFVPLTSLRDPAHVLSTLAQTLGFAEVGEAPLLSRLQAHLHGRQILLVPDNFEHLLAAALFVSRLLEGAAGLKVLATSREALHLYGEHEYAVPPLPVPNLRAPLSVETLLPNPAVTLFVQRAAAVRSDFSLTLENAAAIANLCARLDGLPLAIELAAARVRLFDPQTLLSRLEQRLPVLSGGPRDLPERHRALQATMDWSYSLLETEEQMLLNRLSIFAGSFSLEAAEIICGSGARGGTENGCMDLLARLVDKSLVGVEYGEEETRYRLLETVRQYAQGHLIASGEEAELCERHARFYLALAEAAEPVLASAERAKAMAHLDREYDNLRAALMWAQASEQGELTLRLVGALVWFWQLGWYVSEGRLLTAEAIRAWEEHALVDDPNPSPAYAKALWGAGILAWMQGDLIEARGRFEASIARYRATEDRRGLAHALSNLGLIALSEGNLAEADERTGEAITLARQWGTPWDLALLLYNSGEVTDARGDEPAACELFEESQQLFRQTGDRWGLSIPVLYLGLMAGRRGDYDAACEYVEASLAMRREQGDAWGMVEALALLGQLAQRKGDFTYAANLYTEGLALNRDRVGDKATEAAVLFGLGSVALAEGQQERAAQFFRTLAALQKTTTRIARLSLLSQDDIARTLTAAQ